MANAQLGTVLRHVRRFIGAATPMDCTDGQLLERFLAAGDEAAFTELVGRLGPMVLGVCRRVLANEHDVEDAFQAAFLLLAAKGRSIRQREAVGGWLYGVAHHLALKMKANAARRHMHERLAADMLSTDSVPDKNWQELRSVLDEELRRLPAKYRTPLILCYLEGKTHEEAALELGWPTGSMSRHLARGKELLRERVAQRGVLLSTGLFFTLLVEHAPAAVSARLVGSTVHAAALFAAGNTTAVGVISTQAAALAKEMIQTMFLTRLKLTAALALVMGTLGLGGGVLLHQTVNTPAVAAAADALFLDVADAPPAAGQAGGQDAHGDPLPAGAVQRLGSLQFRHGGPVTVVAFPSGGKTVLTASQDGTIRLWDLGSGKEIRRFAKAPGQVVAPVLPAPAGGRVPAVPRGGAGLNASILALSPDGKTLAVAFGYNAIQLFEVSTGKELRQIPAPQGASLLAFSPDSKLLAGRARDRMITLWEADSGKEVRQIKSKQPARQGGAVIVLGGGGFSPVSASLTFSPDAKVLAMDDVEFDNQKQNASVRLIEVATGKDIRQIKIEQNGLAGIAYSPDGKVLAYGNGTAVQLCEADSGKPIREISGLDNGIATLLFTPDGKTLAVKGIKGSAVHLCDLETGKVVRQIGGQPTPVVPIAAVAVWGGTVGVRDVAISPDGKLLALGGSNALRLFETASGKERAESHGHRGSVSTVVIAADGKTVVSKGGDNTIRRWDPVSGKELSQFAVPAGTTCVAFSPDARLVALGNTDNTIRVHDAASGKELHQLKGHSNGIALVAFSPDSKTLASRGSSDGAIRLYDVARGSDLKTITIPANGKPGNPAPPGGAWVAGLGGPGPGLVFSPDGKLVASGGAGGAGGALGAQVLVPIGGAGAGGDPAIHLWSVATGKVARTIALPQRRGAVSMAFSPDGRVIATENTDGTITLWEVASGKERGQLGQTAGVGRPGVQPGMMVVRFSTAQGGTPAPTTLAFAPDGRTLVARSADQSIRVWDVAALKERHHFTGHQGPIETVAYAPDGKSVASGSDDTTILIWDVSSLSRTSRPPAVALAAGDMASLWADLAADDGAKAFQSIQKLAAAPKEAMPFLQERIKPAAALDLRKVDQWIQDLDSEKFAVRDEATRELEKLGELAVPPLEKVLAGQPSLETRKRAEQLLEKVSGKVLTTEQVRVVRAVEVLEQAGTPEARQFLETLAKGAPGALPTREAQAALQRLARR